MLAAFTSHVPVAAVVNFYGISDVEALLDESFVRRALPAENTRVAAERLSPIHLVRAVHLPVLSIHGTADTTVPPNQTTKLTESLHRAGNQRASQLLVEGGQHGFREFELELAYETVFSFLRRNGVLRY
jgi:dipeptidyl aminopeptidase/acylaminoacyl peptidase